MFPLGQVVATPGVMEVVPHDAIIAALARHVRGDWGDVCEEDRLANNESLKDGSRLLSVYHHGERKFWVITEADRSSTCVLLPEEY